MRYAPLLLLLACQKPVIATVDAEPVASTTASVVVSAPSVSAAPTTEKKVRVTTAPADGDAASLIRTQRLAAKNEGRVLVVYVSASWCDPCQAMKHELASGHLDEKLSKTTLLAFDADRDGDRLAAAGYTFQFIPYVALPGPDGKPTESAQASGKGRDAWRELLKKLGAWQS